MIGNNIASSVYEVPYTTSPSLFLNPRARAGREFLRELHSILDHLVSIHAPARGTESGIITPNSHMDQFNPRARAGRDFRADHHIKHNVSIHAPARGATLRHFTCRFCRLMFRIHAPHAGRDRGGLGRDLGNHEFNPRARAGRVALKSLPC